MVDIDLSILGSAWASFEAYDQAIRQEYAWVPKAQYQLVRRARLEAFLNCPVTFKTSQFRQRYEHQTHENLRRKVSQIMA